MIFIAAYRRKTSTTGILEKTLVSFLLQNLLFLTPMTMHKKYISNQQQKSMFHYAVRAEEDLPPSYAPTISLPLCCASTTDVLHFIVTPYIMTNKISSSTSD